MKTLILICLVVCFGFGNSNLCKMYNDKMQKEYEGMRISIQDEDIQGVRQSCIGFRIYSKQTIIECKDVDLTKLKKARNTILKQCDSLN